MTERYFCAEVYRLFNGETASRNQIIEENNCWITEVDSLIERGVTVGQMTLEGDIVIFPLKLNPYNGKEVQLFSEYQLFTYEVFAQ